MEAAHQRTDGFTVIEALVAVGLLAFLISAFTIVLTGTSALNLTQSRLQAANLVQEEFDSLRALPFTELQTRTNGNFLGLALQRGGWLVTADATAPSAPNVLALTTPMPDVYGETGIAIVPGNQRRDFNYAASVKVTSGGNNWIAGMGFRYQDAENYYRLKITPTGIGAELVRHGVATTLWSRSGTYSPNTWYALEIDASGTNFTVKQGGSTLGTFTDATFAKGDLTFGAGGGATVECDSIAVTESGVTTTWNFDSDTVGTLPAAFRRLSYYDMRNGTGTLTIANYLGSTSIVSATVTVGWSDTSGARTLSETTLISQ